MKNSTNSRMPSINSLLSHILPKHYTTPTAEYAVEKALKDITSRVFFGAERIGLHVMPRHFYTPVPDYAWLRANRKSWDGQNDLVGLNFNPDDQLKWLREISGPFRNEVIGMERFNRIAAAEMGPGFGPIESQVLHCFVRLRQPSQVIEIGSGVTTAIMSEASALNVAGGGRPTRITAFDPYPRDNVRKLPNVEIVPTFVQSVPMDEFARLGEGDLLFIDSSHSVKVGSDVVRLFLDIIPRLNEGVVIHIHDVYLPYLYPRTALSDYFGWQETALIHALLTNNIHLKTLACLSYLHYQDPKGLKEIFPDYDPQENDAGLRTGNWAEKHFPDSLWIQTV